VSFRYPRLVGTTTPLQNVKLTNFGGTTISLDTITVTGANAGDFPIQSQCGSALAAGQSCTLRVVFKPSNKDGRFATLSVPNNTLGLAQSVSLFGIGTLSNCLLAA